MGTINYKTSKYITMGIKPVDGYELEQDADFLECAREEVGEDPDAIRDFASATAYEYMQDDAENAAEILKKYDFYFFKVTIEPGYYEGFSLDIDYKFFPEVFDDSREKAEAQKEVTKIGQFLQECAGCGLVSVWLGWCTKYRSPEETQQDIRHAVKEMREEIKATPTWRQHTRNA